MPPSVISDSLAIHLFFASFLALPPLLNLYFLFTERRFVRLAKKIKLIAPAYYFLMAVTLFSGIILLTMLGELSLGLGMMVVAWLGIFIGEIKRHKLQKPISSHEEEVQAYFVAWAKRKYLLDLLLFLLALGLGLKIF